MSNKGCEIKIEILPEDCHARKDKGLKYGFMVNIEFPNISDLGCAGPTETPEEAKRRVNEYLKDNKELPELNQNNVTVEDETGNFTIADFIGIKKLDDFES